MLIQIEAEVVQRQEGATFLRLKTGFGDQVVPVDDARYTVVAQEGKAR